MGDPPLYKNLFKRLTVLKRPRAPDTHFMWGKVAKNGQILIPNKSTFHTLRRVAETGDSAYDFPRPDDASRKPECATRVLITRPECAEHSGRSILMCAPALCEKSRRNADVAIIWGARAHSVRMPLGLDAYAPMIQSGRGAGAALGILRLSLIQDAYPLAWRMANSGRQWHFFVATFANRRLDFGPTS